MTVSHHLTYHKEELYILLMESLRNSQSRCRLVKIKLKMINANKFLEFYFFLFQTIFFQNDSKYS